MALVLGGLLGAGLVGCGPAMVEVRASQSCDGVNLEACKQQCDEGVPRACYRLGWFYEVGHEVKKSPKTAIELYQKACDAGWAVACRALGNLYWYDETVDRQPKKAIVYYQKACELGVAAACPTELMMAEAEGRKPRAGFSGDASISVKAGGGSESSGSSGSSGSSSPSSPSSPSAPDAPSAPAPDAPTPTVNPSL
jgi:TPR repeat protein